MGSLNAQESPFGTERRHGFTIAYPELLAAPLPAAAKIVYLVIDLHANRRTQISWPGRQLIAQESGLSAHCVTDSIQALEDSGWLRVERCRGKGNRYITLDGPGSPGSSESEPPQFRKRTTGSSESEPEQEPVEQEPGTRPSSPPTAPSVATQPSEPPVARRDNELFAVEQPTAPDHGPSAQWVIRRWIDHRNGDRPNDRLIGQVARAVKGFLRDGADEQHLLAALNAMTDRCLAPGALPALLDEVKTGRRRNGHGPPVDVETRKRMMGTYTAEDYL